jgi:DNA-binding response OmpR family regulator
MADQPDAAAPTPPTIVVVDDEAPVRQLIERLLNEAGYRVVAIGDPSTAVEAVAGARPDLVLCDLTMPGQDGYEVLRQLRTDPRTTSYPVVFLTAHREFTERVRAFRSGALDYIAKPFTREILLRRVAKLLRTIAASAAGESGEQEAPRPRDEDPVVDDEAEESDGSEPTTVAHESHDDGTPEPVALAGEATDVPDFRSFPDGLRTVLVAEDNDAFRGFLVRLLSQQGLRVLAASDGEEALKLAFIERPWLIITDTKMPRLDGYGLCRRVRAHSLIGHTPIVFLSRWDDYQSRYEAFELGADEYISKSAPVRELLMRVHLMLRRYADMGQRGGDGHMRGGIGAIGMVGLLQMCHLTRLTGLLSLRSGSRLVEIRFRQGEIVAAECEHAQGTEAVYEVLGWTRGYFEFAPLAIEEVPALDAFAHLLLDGCRRLDERRHVADETPPA